VGHAWIDGLHVDDREALFPRQSIEQVAEP
jgi:hypothetical protein